MPTSDVTESVSSTAAEILAKLETDPKKGLNAAQLQEPLKKYGPNTVSQLRNPNQLGCPASMLSPSYVSATM